MSGAAQRDPASLGPGPDESLGDLFWAVARRLRHLNVETLGPWKITPGQSRALRTLVDHGTMRLSALSDLLRIAPRSATEVVDELERRGLVERRPDPADRRATLVAVTDAGAETGEAISAARRAEADRFFGTLDEADRAALERILRGLR